MTLPKITVPTATFKVPSTGQELTIRQMVSREEKILLIAKESSQNSEKQTDDVPKAIRQVCINCVMTPNVNIDTDLTTFDLQALFVKIRAISVSNMVKLSYMDNEDGKQYDFDVDLDEVTVDFQERSAATNIIKITDNLVMKMTFPKSAIFVDPDYVNTEDATDFMIRATIDSVVNKDGETKFAVEPKKDQIEFVDSLTIKARNEAVEWLSKLPTLYYKINYTNSKGTERTIELKTLADFFTL